MPESGEAAQEQYVEIPDIRTLHILYTNDLQGEAEQMGLLSTMIKEIRAKEQFTLLVDAGNWAKGTPLSDQYKGKPMTEIMSYMQYEAVNIGEGELSFGCGNLYELSAMAKFPIISCNVIEGGTGIAPPFVKQYVTVEKGPFKVAITGIAAPDPYPGAATSGFAIADPYKVLPGVLAEIREWEPDIVILLSRMGIERDRALAKAFPELNVIIGGSDRKYLERPVTEGQTFICQAGERGKYLGTLAIDMLATIRISKVK